MGERKKVAFAFFGAIVFHAAVSGLLSAIAWSSWLSHHHTGQGLWRFAKDSSKYHIFSVRLYEGLLRGEFSEWFTQPFIWHTKLVSLSYYIAGPNPYSFEIFNAPVWALSVFLVYYTARELTGGRSKAPLVAAVLFGLWPSYFLTTTQLLKDPIYILGNLIFIYGWTCILSGKKMTRLPFYIALGIVMAYSARPYILEILIAFSLLGAALSAVKSKDAVIYSSIVVVLLSGLYYYHRSITPIVDVTKNRLSNYYWQNVKWYHGRHQIVYQQKQNEINSLAGGLTDEQKLALEELARIERDDGIAAYVQRHRHEVARGSEPWEIDYGFFEAMPALRKKYEQEIRAARSGDGIEAARLRFFAARAGQFARSRLIPAGKNREFYSRHLSEDYLERDIKALKDLEGLSEKAEHAHDILAAIELYRLLRMEMYVKHRKYHLVLDEISNAKKMIFWHVNRKIKKNGWQDRFYENMDSIIGEYKLKFAGVTSDEEFSIVVHEYKKRISAAKLTVEYEDALKTGRDYTASYKELLPRFYQGDEYREKLKDVESYLAGYEKLLLDHLNKKMSVIATSASPGQTESVVHSHENEFIKFYSREYKPEALKLKWIWSGLMPRTVEGRFRSLAQARHAFAKSYSGRMATGVDLDIQFNSVQDIISYMPRALAVGYLAPFPDLWFKKGQIVGRAGRLLVGVEMAVLYILIIGALYYLVSAGKGLWQVKLLYVSYSVSMILLTTSTIPNVGTLHRMRYAYIEPVVIMGAIGLVSLLFSAGKINDGKNSSAGR